MVEASVSQTTPMVKVIVSQPKVEAIVSLTSTGVKALVSPQVVVVMPISVKDSAPTTPNKATLVPIKLRGHAAQKAVRNLKKWWWLSLGHIPKEKSL